MHLLAQLIDAKFTVLRKRFGKGGQHFGDWAIFADMAFKTHNTREQVLKLGQRFGRG